ncbi:Similar to FBXO9: F-box only protein 9 (Bos taurus) [Cotesia congregata]|uniref:F-box only protein 9 n=1 Tax=Cotesia congregata TaxID=51543 RepID=A0A8J2H945_COTCN|nr:Similar to FBXO9: F-box only protein 9 (Bos taurus) [Cotesia congregata]
MTTTMAAVHLAKLFFRCVNQQGGSEADEGADEGESSSSPRIQDALANFREQWQRELKISPKKEVPSHSKSGKTSSIETHELSTEDKAKDLFLKGIEYERNGELYDAIRFYKRAVSLVPDIEFRLYESMKPKNKEKIKKNEDIQIVEYPGESYGNDEVDVREDGALVVKLSRIINKNQCLCFPCFEQSMTHVSALPLEIILYILRWVVSSELDIRSLEMFSRVCRGFFISARDPEIWRLACVRVWGVNCGQYEPRYRSWRDMYLKRPRLQYNGCYISKTTYIRQGENSFQDEFYRPWHLVEYFRYVRFFPEGRVLMLTSTDDAQNCVNALKYRTPRNLAVLIGHYRLHDNCITLVMKKQESKSNINHNYKKKKREIIHDSGEQTFHLELEIQSLHKRKNWQLLWIRYNIFTQYKNGQQATTCLNVFNRYPSLKFSRVKSYTQESDRPLQ